MEAPAGEIGLLAVVLVARPTAKRLAEADCAGGTRINDEAEEFGRWWLLVWMSSGSKEAWQTPMETWLLA